MAELSKLKEKEPQKILEKLRPGRKLSCPSWPQVIDRLRKENLITTKGLALTEKGRDWVNDEMIHYPDGRVPSTSRVHVGAVGTSARVQRDPKLLTSFTQNSPKTIAIEMGAPPARLPNTGPARCHGKARCGPPVMIRMTNSTSMEQRRQPSFDRVPQEAPAG
jgi:hypothetical protein